MDPVRRALAAVERARLHGDRLIERACSALDRVRLPRWLGSRDAWDRRPTPLLLALGLVPATAVGWLALKHPAATVLLVLLVPLLVWWQERRLRLVWERGDLGEIVEAPPVRERPAVPQPVAEGEPESEPATSPSPPYVIKDRRLTLVMLPAGEFWMGANRETDPQADQNEAPRHRVRVSSFAIGQAPVIRGLYRAVMGRGPSGWSRGEDDDALPANYVSWEDAVRCCNALSTDAGFTLCYRETPDGWVWERAADGYRLPTEAEWEYACRAGTETPWFWGTEENDADRNAWFGEDWQTESLHPVMQKAPNAWRLYDMAGSAWEWCWDWYGPYTADFKVDPHGPSSAGGRVLRGGSFFDEVGTLRCARRTMHDPGTGNAPIGFRCVRGSGHP